MIVGRLGAAGGLLLGMPGGSAGGTRAGLEGTRGTAPEFGSPPKAVWAGPGRDGTGGAENAGEGLRAAGGPGVGPLTAGGRLGGGAAAEAARDAGGGLGSLAIQLSSTGGGTGVEMVVVLMSPMRTRASFRA